LTTFFTNGVHKWRIIFPIEIKSEEGIVKSEEYLDVDLGVDLEVYTCYLR